MLGPCLYPDIWSRSINSLRFRGHKQETDTVRMQIPFLHNICIFKEPHAYTLMHPCSFSSSVHCGLHPSSKLPHYSQYCMRAIQFQRFCRWRKTLFLIMELKFTLCYWCVGFVFFCPTVTWKCELYSVGWPLSQSTTLDLTEASIENVPWSLVKRPER